MSRENVEIVRRAYEAWNGSDAEAATELLAPEIEWHLQSNFPESGTWQGREKVLQGLESLSSAWEELSVEVRELIDAGERVVAIVRFHGRAATTGIDIEGAGVDAQVWTVRGGRAVEVRMFSGTRDALESVGLG